MCNIYISKMQFTQLMWWKLSNWQWWYESWNITNVSSDLRNTVFNKIPELNSDNLPLINKFELFWKAPLHVHRLIYYWQFYTTNYEKTQLTHISFIISFHNRLEETTQFFFYIKLFYLSMYNYVSTLVHMI